MILRLTRSLGKYVGGLPEKPLSIPGNPFLDWSLLDFSYEGQAYLILANTSSLSSTVIPVSKEELQGDWTELLRPHIYELFQYAKKTAVYKEHVAQKLKRMRFSKPLDKHATGVLKTA